MFRLRKENLAYSGWSYVYHLFLGIFCLLIFCIYWWIYFSTCLKADVIRFSPAVCCTSCCFTFLKRKSKLCFFFIFGLNLFALIFIEMVDLRLFRITWSIWTVPKQVRGSVKYKQACNQFVLCIRYFCFYEMDGFEMS